MRHAAVARVALFGFMSDLGRQSGLSARNRPFPSVGCEPIAQTRASPAKPVTFMIYNYRSTLYRIPDLKFWTFMMLIANGGHSETFEHFRLLLRT